MARYALITDGVVKNIIVADAWPEGVRLTDDMEISPGDLYDGVTFSRPAPEPAAPAVPTAVSMRQARLALLGAGLLDTVDAAIAAMPGQEGQAARIEWEYATEVKRDSALVAGLSGALGLTDTQLDTLFTQAAKL